MTIYLLSTSGTVSKELARVAMRATNKSKPRVLTNYSAIADSPEAFRYMTQLVELHFEGAQIDRWLVKGEPGDGLIGNEALVRSADILFLSGGDPVLGAKLLRDAGADEWLRLAAKDGIACYGVSAGAIMLGSHWAEWPDEHTGGPFDGGKLVPCANVATELSLDCHAEKDDWAEAKMVHGMLRAAHLRSRVIGIPSNCGIVVHDGGREDAVGKKPLVPIE